MKRYAVVGASSGVGRDIVARLSAQGAFVRAISRHPQDAGGLVEPYGADVTDAAAMQRALDGGFDAVFFTVDIHGKRLQREQVRQVMVDGCANTVAAAKAGGIKRFVLLSVIGPEKPSWVWWILNALKPGMRGNILEREQALRASGMQYVICRAARLTDGTDALPTILTAPLHRAAMRRSIKRGNLAQTLIDAASIAPADSIWDVFAGTPESMPSRWDTVPFTAGNQP